MKEGVTNTTVISLHTPTDTSKEETMFKRGNTGRQRWGRQECDFTEFWGVMQGEKKMERKSALLKVAGLDGKDRLMFSTCMKVLGKGISSKGQPI